MPLVPVPPPEAKLQALLSRTPAHSTESPSGPPSPSRCSEHPLISSEESSPRLLAPAGRVATDVLPGLQEPVLLTAQMGPRTGTWGEGEEKVAERSSARPGDL